MLTVANGVPRRSRIDLNTPVEAAIRTAMVKVEETGADVRLTEAIVLLQQAFNKVADYIDDQIGSK